MPKLANVTFGWIKWYSCGMFDSVDPAKIESMVNWMGPKNK